MPSASTSGITTVGGHCCFSTSAADTIVVSAMTEPTDRSMPPERITKVMPTATMHRKALSISRLRKTWLEKKPV